MDRFNVIVQNYFRTYGHIIIYIYIYTYTNANMRTTHYPPSKSL